MTSLTCRIHYSSASRRNLLSSKKTILVFKPKFQLKVNAYKKKQRTNCETIIEEHDHSLKLIVTEL